MLILLPPSEKKAQTDKPTPAMSVYAGVLFRNQGDPVLNLRNPEGLPAHLQRQGLDALAALRPCAGCTLRICTQAIALHPLYRAQSGLAMAHSIAASHWQWSCVLQPTH